jgi:hypothetical protein
MFGDINSGFGGGGNRRNDVGADDLGRGGWDDGRAGIKARVSERTAEAVDRWVDDQMFEEDLRAVLLMMRPHRRERLMGWQEYRTGAKHFRATIAWDEHFAEEGNPQGGELPSADAFAVPNMVDVLEAILVGSIRSDAELGAEEEAEAYTAVVRELGRRVEQFVRASC